MPTTNSTTEIEIWKPIPEYEGLYEASNLGRIRRFTPKILKPSFGHNGYYQVSLHKSGYPKTHVVHRLVASTFLGVRPSGAQINHKDGVKVNNAEANLEYISPLENHRHAMVLGLKAKGNHHGSAVHPERIARGERNGSSRLTETAVRNIRYLCSSGVRKTLVAEMYGLSPSTVFGIASRKSWKHI